MGLGQDVAEVRGGRDGMAETGILRGPGRRWDVWKGRGRRKDGDVWKERELTRNKNMEGTGM